MDRPRRSPRSPATAARGKQPGPPRSRTSYRSTTATHPSARSIRVADREAAVGTPCRAGVCVETVRAFLRLEIFAVPDDPPPDERPGTDIAARGVFEGTPAASR